MTPPLEILRNKGYRQAMRLGYLNARAIDYSQAPPIFSRIYEAGVLLALATGGARSWPADVVWPFDKETR